jgi:hypothetical protein
VSLFLYAFIDDSENRLLPNNVMMIWNYGGDKEGLKERRGGAKEQQRRPSQVGLPIQVELESNSDSMNSQHQNHHPDHIPTLFWTLFTDIMVQRPFITFESMLVMSSSFSLFLHLSCPRLKLVFSILYLFLSHPRLKYIFSKRKLNMQALYPLLPFLAANHPWFCIIVNVWK